MQRRKQSYPLLPSFVVEKPRTERSKSEYNPPDRNLLKPPVDLLSAIEASKLKNKSIKKLQKMQYSHRGSGENIDFNLKDTTYRVVLMGAAGVGKTSIINRFLHDTFDEKYKATVEELHQGVYDVAGVTVTLNILDTSGAYQFPAMRRLSIARGDAFILVYSVGDKSSFEEVNRLRQQILEEKGFNNAVPIVIVGNKSDLHEEKRQVTTALGDSTTSLEWGHMYVEASAKDNVNIDRLFKDLLRAINIQYRLMKSPFLKKRRVSSPHMAINNTKSKGLTFNKRKNLRKLKSCTVS